MKNNLIYLVLFATCCFSVISCDDEDEVTVEPPKEIVSERVDNLHAEQNSDYTTTPPTVTGEYVKFSFKNGEITTASDDWDIAFRGLTIIVNGGEQVSDDEPMRTGNAAAYVVDGTFAEINEVDETMFSQDSVNGYAIPKNGEGWYEYNMNTHVVNALAGKIIVVQTADGHYAKMEVLSYYKDAPAEPDASTDEAQYYTFNYVYQPNDGVNQFE